jgi:ribosomal protein S18 acetylase RimI-like enzyme
MRVNVDQATLLDLDQLVELRLAYLAADFGELSPGESDQLRAELPGYLTHHLQNDLLAFVVRADEDDDALEGAAAEGGAATSGTIASCAWLLLVPKPPSPRFPHGRTGVLFNVYTRPAYRRRGLARQVMSALIEEAHRRQLDVIELHATDDGYPLYHSLGFADDSNTHRPMRLMLA